MRKFFTPHLWCCFCLTWLLGVEVKATTVLYQEHFNYPVGGGTNAITLASTEIPWQAYATASATNITVAGSGKYNVWVSSLNPTPKQTALGGYIYTRADSSAVTSFFAVISKPLTDSISFPDSGLLANFHGNASHAGMDVRMIFEIGGQWYATANDLNLAVGAQGRFTSTDPAIAATNAQSQFLTKDAANWVSFHFTPGSSLGLGGAVAEDLSGNITRVGFYTMQPDIAELSMVRLDALTLLLVPEPSRFLFLGLFLIVLVLKRRRV